ncbi:MAG: hypothetical protein AAFV95_01195 [Bacteroidota bacterium]
MKARFVLPILLSILCCCSLGAQNIYGKIDLSSPTQYHRIKLYGKPSFSARLIDIRNDQYTYIYKGDTLSNHYRDIKYVRVYQRPLSAQEYAQPDTSKWVLLEMQNGSELFGKLMKVSPRYVTFKMGTEEDVIDQKYIRKAYFVQADSRKKLEAISFNNYLSNYYFDDPAKYTEKDILLVLRNGNQLVGRVGSVGEDSLEFIFQGQKLQLTAADVRRAYSLQEGKQEIDKRAHLFQTPYYGQGNLFVTPSGFLPKKRELEYRSIAGLVHSIEGAVAPFMSVTVGYSLPEILFGRVNLVARPSEYNAFSLAGTAARAQIRDNFNLYNLQAAYTFGRPNNHGVLSISYNWYDDGDPSGPAKTFVVSAGGKNQIGRQWMINYAIYGFEDTFGSYAVLPALTFGWTLRGNQLNFGTVMGIVDGFFGALPYASFSKRLYR